MNKLLLLSFLISSIAFGKNKVIYGEDNRVDVFNSTNKMFVDLSQSTAAMISKSNLIANGEFFEIQGRTLESRGICSFERFSKQMSAANCSGFLVGKDLLVTAGHCITNAESCSNNYWVFDFKIDHEEQYEVEVHQKNVFSCKEIISRSLDFRTQNDYALIRLDRRAIDKNILNVRKRGKPQVGDDLVVIGHPSGLPSKIADGAKVRALKTNYFVADLDTYAGNSGSAVFNATSGLVEGILVRGRADYIYDQNLRCRVSNVLNETLGGEDVTYINNIEELNKNI